MIRGLGRLLTNSKQLTVFSGVQPTGSLHIGNYLGAIRNFVNIQDQYDAIYSIVDLHAITVWQDPEELKNSVLDVAAAYLAAGIDPDRSTMFVQSQVSGHAEMGWILNCVARVGWLNRMTQFKEKAGKNKENASVGLYVYPNLMAADILLYKADLVPVGDDQKQHLEITRDIAQRFNHDFLDNQDEAFFPLPEPLILPVASRVMSLRDGQKKMSKSDPSAMSRLELLDDNDSIKKKISKAKTDPEVLPNTVEKLSERPEAHNLISIYAGLDGETMTEIVERFAGWQFSSFKKELTDLAIAKIAPLREQILRLRADEQFLKACLEKGREKASVKANLVLGEVRRLVGLL